ncbi:sensor histidine kinase [Geodermatophilus sp. SYSU D00697]
MSGPHLGSDPAPPRARGGPRIPLRITLVALLVVLVTVALAATGLAATSLLRGYLTGQQDDQLRLSAENVARNPWRVLGQCSEGGPGYPSPDYLGCLPPGEDDLVLVLGPVNDPGRSPDLDVLAERVDDDGPPGRDRIFTVPAEDDHTSWRIAAVDLPEGWTALVGTDLAGDERVLGRLVRIQVVVGLIVLFLLGTAGYVLVRNSLRPLTEVERTARAIAAGDLSQRVPEGDERTEVGRLTTALNGMLSRIERAFRAQQASEEQARASEHRMRRFVADASHELRTPLTSIRGFAELYRQGAVGTPEETARLMQRIESEGARMGVLVEDLLQLARLDQQRPLSIAPVDLAEVAGDAVHDARAVQPERPITLDLDSGLSELPVVLGDEARLRQVVGNLVTNALVHTPPTAPVTVSLSDEPATTADGEDGGVVVLRVADEGPGMAPEDAARVFERFYRADPARARTAGGTGLGLAIVSALVAAHGGTVHLDTAPGRGAAFTVRLPRSGPGGPGTAPVEDGAAGPLPRGAGA